jgi:hypothetical protein
MRTQISLAALALASLTFGQSAFTHGGGTGTNTQGHVYSVPTNTPLRQYNVHAGKGGVSAQSGPGVLYDNTVNYTGFYMPGTTEAAPMDDLHMSSAGLVNGYSFIYYDPAGNTALTTVEVAFFTNAASDPSPYTQTLLYDAFITTPGDGLWQVNVDLSSTPFAATQDLWMGIAFGTGVSTSTEAGWVTYSPPVVGSSHDLDFEFVSGTYHSGGDYGVALPLSYGAAVYTTPEPGTVATVVTGLLGLVGMRLRRKSA